MVNLGRFGCFKVNGLKALRIWGSELWGLGLQVENLVAKAEHHQCNTLPKKAPSRNSEWLRVQCLSSHNEKKKKKKKKKVN